MAEFSKFRKKITKQYKRLKETVDRIREEQEVEFEEPKKPRSMKREKHEEIIMHFSLESVAKATLVIIGMVILANFLGQIADIILIFFISILFAAALDPTVDALEKYKIPRSVSVIVIFLLLIAMLGFFISQLIPLVATQLVELVKSFATFINNLSHGNADIPFGDTFQGIVDDILEEIDRELVLEQLQKGVESLSTELQAFAGNTFGAIKSIFNGVFNFALVLILTFFLVVDEKGVDDFFISLFPSKHGAYIVNKLEVIKHKVGFWLRGQIILMFVMFVLTLIGLLILGVDYALTLSMMAGIMELVPVVGPILAGVPAVLVAFNQSPWLALWVLGLILLLQQIEGNLIVPLVMKKAVGLSPIIVILSMLVGYKSLGILGTIIAVPVATTLSIFVRDYAEKEK